MSDDAKIKQKQKESDCDLREIAHELKIVRSEIEREIVSLNRWTTLLWLMVCAATGFGVVVAIVIYRIITIPVQ